jgi:hypothetical protein
MRRRGGLNKIGILAIALIIALGAVGVTYSAWVEEIYIEGSLYTGDINASVDCNGAGTIVPAPPAGIDTSITCSPTVYPMKLQFSVTNALPGKTYTCPFKVNNEDVDPFDPFESVPIKIDKANTTLTPQEDTYTGILAGVILPTDPQIDPGLSAGGTVQITVAGDAPALQNMVYTLEVKVVRWNK